MKAKNTLIICVAILLVASLAIGAGVTKFSSLTLRNDLIVEGDATFEGEITVDGAVVFGGGLNLPDDIELTFGDTPEVTCVYDEASTDRLVCTFTANASGLNVAVGNLFVGDGTPDHTPDGEDIYVEGHSELKGHVYTKGNVYFVDEAGAYFGDGNDAYFWFNETSSDYFILTLADTAKGMLIQVGNLSIGDAAQTQTQDGEDFYVEGYVEVDEIIYADGGIIVGDDIDMIVDKLLAWDSDNYFIKADNATGWFHMNGPAESGFNILTGNLKVGDGLPGQTHNGEDAYIEGLVEVDGIIYADGGAEVATALNLSYATVSEAVCVDGSGNLVSEAGTSCTELGYLSDVTGAIQSQIDGKIDDPGAVTDHAVVRWDTTAGDTVQDTSGVTISDAFLLTASGGLSVGSSTTGLDFTGTYTDGISFAGATPTYGQENAFIDIGTYTTAYVIAMTDVFIPYQAHLDNTANPGTAKDLAAMRLRVDNITNPQGNVNAHVIQTRQQIAQDIGVFHGIQQSAQIADNITITSHSYGIDAKVEGSGNLTGSYSVLGALMYHTGTTSGDNYCVEADMGAGADATGLFQGSIQATATADYGLRISNAGTLTTGIQLNGTIGTDIVTGDGTLDMGGGLKLLDDQKITLGTDNDVTMEFDEDGDDTLLITGDTTVAGALDISEGIFAVNTAADSGKAAIKIEQDDADEPFITFVGTEAGDYSSSISTANGDGAVDGPQKSDGDPAGWEFEKMIFIKINAEETGYWFPVYKEDPS